MALRPCSSAHCGGADAEINEICKAEGWPVNHPVLTRDAQGPCTCSCSCLAHGTPVQAGEGVFRAIESFLVGDYVLAASRKLDWAPRQVEFSQGTTGASRQKYTVLVMYQDTFLAVTSDHLFLLRSGALKRADRLNPADELVSPDGKPVAIKSVHIGDYTAGFHHIATKKETPDADLTGHLLNTNGIVSADYAVQLFARQGEPSPYPLMERMEREPVVGSPEYVERFGKDCLRAPVLDSSLINGRLLVSVFNAADITGPTFVAAETTAVDVPPDACRFISDEEAEAKATDAHRPWNDPLSREWTEYLIDHHRAFFPNVQYHLDWADNTVNAYAWVQNGVRHVALKGGLIRHFALELEGIALVLAHELAHHYGGSPTFPGGLSCEGQADYAGVNIIMRRVWFGEQYITTADRGIQQMANFFGVPNDPTVPGGSSNCNHPPGACRIATYHAAVSLRRKPNCAV